MQENRRPSLQHLYFFSAGIANNSDEAHPIVRFVYLSGTPTVEEIDDPVAVSLCFVFYSMFSVLIILFHRAPPLHPCFSDFMVKTRTSDGNAMPRGKLYVCNLLQTNE